MKDAKTILLVVGGYALTKHNTLWNRSKWERWNRSKSSHSRHPVADGMAAAALL